ncbi:hypothetical protein F0919_17845 [Taibaiella lutea]|uniref:Uncharacterized protein n=1 Tax=Taibaiella lutea TaxID=2608001 RepID=A0A5M6CBW7_9BACT|nr:hypothetical protein [Taibaiella lutea]KAA5532644.1 hypothetical protein F0919_17845 [Taibaiella lutea]
MITRDDLNQSNNTKILGAGKVTKVRHSSHNNKMADYIDQEVLAVKNLIQGKHFFATSTDTNPSKFVFDNLNGQIVAKIEGPGEPLIRTLGFTQSDVDGITTITPNLNSIIPNTEYLITLL